MTTKAITFTAPYRAEFRETELPELQQDEVSVQLAVSTISSGTERANYVGDPNVNGASTVAPPFPRRSGYSSAGVVTAVGKSVQKVKVGDRVALSWSTHSACCIMKEQNVHPIISEAISFEEAALLHISTFPAAAVRKCRLEFGESALVMGQGVLGMIAVKLLRAAGAVPLIAVDPVSEKREQALAIGADYALGPFASDFADTVKKLTGGGVNVAIEVTGNGPALDSVLDCMARFGRVALLGCTRDKNFTVDYYRKIHFPGITLVGAHTLARPAEESSGGWWTTADDVLAVQKLLAGRRITLADLIGETHSPAEAPQLYERLAAERSFPLVQFDWRMLHE